MRNIYNIYTYIHIYIYIYIPKHNTIIVKTDIHKSYHIQKQNIFETHSIYTHIYIYIYIYIYICIYFKHKTQTQSVNIAFVC